MADSHLARELDRLAADLWRLFGEATRAEAPGVPLRRLRRLAAGVDALAAEVDPGYRRRVPDGVQLAGQPWREWVDLDDDDGRARGGA